MGRSINGRTPPAGWGLGRGVARSPGWKAWVLGLGLVAGCGHREPLYEAKLLTDACTGTPVLKGVHYLRFRVTGAGMEPVERYVPVEQGTAALPGVPAGQGRVLEVRGYTDLPSNSGQVVAVGRSHPFDVPESSQAGLPAVSVALRRVNEVMQPGRADAKCVGLAQPRSGHTATLLEDGRVLLAGGVQLDRGGNPVTLSSVELFDPVMGTVAPAPELGTGSGASFVATPRAFHTATRLLGGKVLLAGGEVESPEGTVPLQSVLVLDVARGTYTGVELREPRSHHAAAMESSGRVLFVGGGGAAGEVVHDAEGFDPETGQVFAVPTPVPRVGMSAMPVGDGRRIAVVGGSNGSELQPEVLLFAYAQGTFVPAGEGGLLREPRRDAALVPFGGPDRLAFIGGHDAPDVVENSRRLLAASEVIAPEEASAQVTGGPTVFPREGLCAVALPDGRVMTVGGVVSSASGYVSDSHVELLVPGKNGAATGLLGLTALERQRQRHTCTVLEDGSVLIAGGLDDDGLQRTTLGDLVIYTPVPLD